MKNRIILFTLAVLVGAAGCSAYKREPDFRNAMIPGAQTFGTADTYVDDGWLPHPERYTQRFTWKMRYLARQLSKKAADWDFAKNRALLTTIVPVDDLYKATSFGRLCSEQLLTEMSKEGFKVVEARKTDIYLVRDHEGEFSLSRNAYWLGKEYKADAVIVGVYSRSGDQALINARMVDTRDSRVIASASAMMNLKGDRFLQSVFMEDDKTKMKLPPVGKGIVIRDKVDPEQDSHADILQSKVADMAGAMVETAKDKIGPRSKVAVTTFVDVDNLYRANTFGRYMTEQLMEGIRARGLPAFDLRMAPELYANVRIGELALSREMSQVMTNLDVDAVIVGTYTHAGDKIIVNGRMALRKTHEIIGAASVVVDARPSNKFVTAMLKHEITEVMPMETVEGF